MTLVSLIVRTSQLLLNDSKKNTHKFVYMYKETEESIKGIVLDVYNITKNSNMCSISLYYKTLVLNTYRQILSWQKIYVRCLTLKLIRFSTSFLNNNFILDLSVKESYCRKRNRQQNARRNILITNKTCGIDCEHFQS